jgi:glycosyltransferase involved in cell wall biosynthesis
MLKFVLHPVQNIAWDYCTWFYNHCDSVIAPSDGIARLLKAHGIAKPMHVIPTGISFTKAHADNKSKFLKKHGILGKAILHVGRVTREKNIEAIIDAIQSVDATLMIASDGPHREELRKYAKRKRLDDKIVFLGYLSKEELQSAYSSADAFVCASKSETQGIVLLEAAAAGLPIVVLDAPVVSDFLRENKIGIISDEKGFSDNIRRAIEDVQLKKKSAASASRIAKRYDISRCAKELADVYSGLIESTKRN